jgi:acyl-coenzyme A synthetase/AMP-(fatty) acid ligase
MLRQVHERSDAEPQRTSFISNANGIAFWLCSSGSTGKPEGAVHTHANLSWTAEGVAATDKLAVELKAFVKARMAPHKYPREILFAEDLPKTATGKIQRFKLREPALDA